MTLLKWLTFLVGSLTVTLTVLLFWIYLLSSDANTCYTMALPPLGNLIMLLSQFPLIFQQTQNGMPRFMA